jgi:hypothetical protein
MSFCDASTITTHGKESKPNSPDRGALVTKTGAYRRNVLDVEIGKPFRDDLSLTPNFSWV